MRTLTKKEAEQFVMMVLSGAPVPEVVRYFCDPSLTDAELVQYEEQWPIQPEVLAVMERMTGGGGDLGSRICGGSPSDRLFGRE